MKTIRLLALAACAFSAACKSEVVTIEVTVQEDGSGRSRSTLCDPSTQNPDPRDGTLPTSGLAAGQVRDVGYRNIVASFADVRRVDLGGITLRLRQDRRWTPAAGERARGSGRGVAQTGSPGGGAVGRRRSGDSRGGDPGRREAGRREAEASTRGTKSSTCASSCLGDHLPVDRRPGQALGWRCECGGDPERVRRSTHLVIPIRLTGQEPERVVWEVRTKAK